MPSAHTGPADSFGCSYELTFPSNLAIQPVIAWLYALSGTLPPGLVRLWGAPTTVLELWATGDGRDIRYHLTPPAAYADYLVSQLRTLVPGTRAVPAAGEPDRRTWTRVVELGMRAPRRTLRIIDPESVAASLLAAVQRVALRSGDALLYQWVIRPAIPQRPPRPPLRSDGQARDPFTARVVPRSAKNRVADQRAKLGGATYLCVLRIGVRTSTGTDARDLLSALRAALRSTQTADNAFYARLLPQHLARRRLARQQRPFFFPIHLTATELAALALPIGTPQVAGLPRARTRQLPATGAIPSQGGPMVMRSDWPGDMRRLCITPADLTTHLMIAGRTGTGKTSLMCSIAEQLIQNDYGIVLIETKGDADETLFHEVLQRIPSHRVNDCVIVDVSDEQYAAGYTMLDDGNPQVAVEHLCALFEHLYRDTRGVYVREALYHGLLTLIARPGYSFVDLVPLLSPRDQVEEAWRDELVVAVDDPEVRDFWRRFRERPDQRHFVQPVLDRVWQLNARSEIRRIIGQSRSSFSLRNVLQQHKVLLFNLSGVGETTATLAGSLLVSSLWTAIKAARVDRPNFIFLDEWASLLDLPTSMDELLMRARGYQHGLVLATQGVAGLPTAVRGAALTNAASQIVFAGGSDDARLFAREFGGGLTEDEFRTLGRFQVIARLAAGGETHRPVTGTTEPPKMPTGLAAQVRAASRQRYSRPVAEVEQEIRQRRQPTEPPPPKRRPTIGKQEWR